MDVTSESKSRAYPPERLARAEQWKVDDHVQLPGAGAGVVVGRHSPYTVAVSFAGAREVLVSATMLEPASDKHAQGERAPPSSGSDGAATPEDVQPGLF